MRGLVRRSSPRPRRRPGRWGDAGRRPRWVVVPVALAVVLALAAPAAANPAAAGEGRPPVPTLDWAECGDGFQCATATVPLDYDRPHSRTITLALIRLPAADPARRIGSLFPNPGGPGGSGVQFVREAARLVYSPETLARFDIVGLDPRGVGGSTPVRCFTSPAQEAEFEADYPIFPVTREEERRSARKSVELARRCWSLSGWLLPHLSTANVARDLDLLRQAVGDKRLTYVGYSYGTYLGATYANLFPKRVRALVLDAVVDPTRYPAGGNAPLPFLRIGSERSATRALHEFFRQCAAVGPQRCPFAAGGSPAAKFAELAERLRAHPIEVPTPEGPITVGYAELVAVTFQLLYSPIWTDLAVLLQELYVATEPAAAAQVLARARTADAPGLAPMDESQISIICADTNTPDDPRAWPPIARRADRRSPYFGSLLTYISQQPCASWRKRDPDRYLGPWDARTSAPALILGTRFDPVTPYEGAVKLARIMPRSRLLTLDGYGHTTILASSCTAQAVERYLLEVAPPPRGTVCAPDFQPFDQPTAPASAGAAARLRALPGPLAPR
jgi:pimeloyl-ACP methyl ester carboxylesterase